ncbi:heavy metal translocating p-type atpase [Ilyonectria robusta]
MDSASANERLPSTRTRKRKTAVAAAEDDKKRAQNRVAQKSFREKQQSRLQYLESFVEAIKSGQATQDEDARYDKLLRSHLELLEENRQLKDNLIGLRQKLTYIGQSASAAAEDSVFDALLKDHGSERGSAVSPPQNQVEPRHDPTAAVVVQNRPHLIPTTSAGYTMYEAARTSSAPDSRGKEPLSMPSTQAMLPTGFYGHLPKLPSVAGGAETFDAIHPLTDPFFLSVDFAPISSKTSFASKVEAGCKRYISEIAQANSQASAGQLATRSNFDQAQLIQQIASAGVNVIASFSGLTTYIYGSNFFRCLERILQWRLCNTTEFRMAIPEPFRPTPLQDASTSHPIIIDFITWPSIRDQMILHQDSLDLDLLCQELTLHAVIEIPEKEIAVGVYDYVQNAMNVQEKQSASGSAATCLEETNWTYINVPVDLAFSMGFDPAEDLIVQELTNRVQGASLTQPDAGTSSKPADRSSKIGEERHDQIKQRGISHPGIYHMRTWKLSKEFAWKWPILDCSSVISTYDKVSYATASQLLG